MDLKNSLVSGGVLIVHQIHEGKHQYEVENVVKYKRENGGKMFVRRRDKLMQINGIDLQELTPEELAQILSEGNPMLTVHKPGSMAEHPEPPSPVEDSLHPFTKESTTLSFSWEMTREVDVEENEVEQEEEKEETVGTEEDVCPDDNKEDGEGEGDLLIIEMKKTSISVVRGRGCDAGSPCQGCHGTGCSFDDIVMVSESSRVTLVPRGGGSFKQEKKLNFSVQHMATHQYLRGICSQRIVYASPNPEKITIYYYRSNNEDRGMPVVLNITGSNCFLRCCKDGDRVLLQVQTCEQQMLKRISMSDENAMSFVFYMAGVATRQRKFESALHAGWFIHIVNTDSVEMGTLDEQTEQSFLFIIQK